MWKFGSKNHVTQHSFTAPMILDFVEILPKGLKHLQPKNI